VLNVTATGAARHSGPDDLSGENGFISDWPGRRAGAPPTLSPFQPAGRSEKVSLFAPQTHQQSLPILLSIQLQSSCNCLLLSFRAFRSLSNMFRQALRQSSRAVGAISATGRVAAVSVAPSTHSDLNPIEKALRRPQIHRAVHLGAQLSSWACFGGGARGFGAPLSSSETTRRWVEAAQHWLGFG